MSFRKLTRIVALFLIAWLVLLSYRLLFKPAKPEIFIHYYLTELPPSDQVALPLEVEEWKSRALDLKQDGYYLTRTRVSDNTVVFYLLSTYQEGNVSIWPDAKGGTVRFEFRGGHFQAPVYAIHVVNTVLKTMELRTPHGWATVDADNIPTISEPPLRLKVKFD